MTKQPLLSICIPTYNRAPFLERLLDSILSQREFLDTNDIEIVVDDGPSKDNTMGIVQKYIEQYPNKIRYYRNQKVVGMCPAFLESISFSNGLYTWLFGSDDIMSPDSLQKLLAVIRKESPMLILSDRKEFSDLSQIKFTPNDLLYSSYVGFSSFSSYLGVNYKESSHNKSHYFTYISIFCFKTDCYRNNLINIIDDKLCTFEYLKYNYFNWAIVIYSYLFSDKICLIKNNIVFTQVSNHGWSHNMKIALDLSFLFSLLEKNHITSHNYKKLVKEIKWPRQISGFFGYLKNAPVIKYFYPTFSSLWNKIRS